MQPSSAWIIELLGLKPHGTCGFMGETYVSDLQIPAGSLPADYQGGRPLGGVFYFLVTPQAGVRLHRIRSDQMYHHYLGDPLEVLLLHPGGDGEVRVVGSDLAAGMRYADSVQMGLVNINETTNYWEPHLPWGGRARSESGIGRVGGAHPMDTLTELQTVLFKA